jgi:hypothetical protein
LKIRLAYSAYSTRQHAIAQAFAKLLQLAGFSRPWPAELIGLAGVKPAATMATSPAPEKWGHLWYAAAPPQLTGWDTRLSQHHPAPQIGMHHVTLNGADERWRSPPPDHKNSLASGGNMDICARDSI